ncbi:MAG TPA: lytic murein transglycosylase [Solirubrobacteraceae bacterium]|nr:lytic murein transglycosylase [Solirubrobacteraceae bacterium]
MTSRIVTVGVVCASLYAAALGAGAVAQDQESAPAPTVAAETATPQAPESTTTAEPSPFPSPVETVVEATPEPSQTSTPPADPTAEPTSAATEAATQAPAQSATPGAATPTATPALGVDKSRGGRRSKPNRAQGSFDGECRGGGKVVGTVVDSSTSTSARGCTPEEHDDDRGGATDTPAPIQRADGTPTPANPGFSLATPGPAPIGVPNFFIDKFRIPPFLLPIYQAAGIQYGVRWEILAAINEIETDYGRNLNISSAGALGWMQFMPATWDMYGVDANGDREKDPFNPVDAIFAAARYLRAAGADKDLYRAIFAYNHADWYVESVLMRARVIGGLPADLVGSLTGLTQGRFPVAARATYAGALPEEGREKRFRPGENVAHVVESEGTRRSIRVYSRQGAPVIAVQDGRISRLGHSSRLGNFVELQDSYGNTYLYAGLGKLAEAYPFPKQRKATRRELALPEGDPTPRRAASATTKRDLGATPSASRTVKAKPAKRRLRAGEQRPSAFRAELPAALPAKQRLFANPDRPNARPAGGGEQLALAETGTMVLDGKRLSPRDFVPKPLKKGARVIGGTILGRIGKTDPTLAPHVRFEIRPAGRGAPRIDPKPILDGWKLLESTAIYRSAKRNPLFGEDAETPSIGQIMLMSKQALQRHVLRNPHIDIYECGRHDVATGQIDRRVLATLEFLAASGLKPTISSMRCGHGQYTASGNISEHSSGNAVDIAAVNGIAITPATQGKASITDLTIQRLLTLQGTMKPHQIISLMTFEGADNTFAMGDHGDHIHVGFRPVFGANSKAARRMAAVLKPDQWLKLIDRIAEIDNPAVREQPSKFSVKVTKRASEAHRGE